MLEFELIQVAVGTRERLSRCPSAKEWNALYAFAEKQSLVGVMFGGIELLPADQRPPMELLMEWLGQAEYTKACNEVQNQRCAELTSTLREGGFRCCVLKGQGTATLYPHPEYRQCGDIDMWVAGDMSAIIAFASSRGVEVPHIDIKHADMNFFADVPVEVHFYPSYSYNPIYGKRLKEWTRKVAGEQFANYDEKLGFAYPTPKFNLVYSLLHIYRHLFSEGIGLRQMLDYYYILQHSSAEERAEAYETVCSLGMKNFAGAAMFVLQEVFGLKDEQMLCQSDEKSGRFVLNEIMIAGNFGHYDNRTKVVAKENRFRRGWVQLGRNLRFARYYPQEVLWSPFWKLWHYAWRKRKGYL